jgi:hypothetical protein
MRFTFIFAALLGIGSLCMFAGCEKKPAAQPPAGHAHHEHGPNEGELIEIPGGEEYHAELVEGKDGLITIFVLDKDKKPLLIAAEPITINMVVNANPVEFTLTPKPQTGEPEGKSSRFEAQNKDLGVALENPEAKRELRLKVGDKAYTAPFPHFDDHHEHK